MGGRRLSPVRVSATTPVNQHAVPDLRPSSVIVMRVRMCRVCEFFWFLPTEDFGKFDPFRRAGGNHARAPNITSGSVHPSVHVSDNAPTLTCSELESEPSKHQPITHITITPPTPPSQPVLDQQNAFCTPHHIAVHSRLTRVNSSSTLRQESLRSPWGQVKSTKGFGNFATPKSGSHG